MRPTISPERQALIDELEALLAERQGKSNMPGGTMPGVTGPDGKTIALPGMPAAPVLDTLLPGPRKSKASFSYFGENSFPVDIQPNVNGLLPHEQRNLDDTEFVADLGRGGSQILKPGDDKTPRIENITGGANKIIGTVLPKLGPMAIGAALRFPVPTLVGAATGLVGKGLVEGGARASDYSLGTDIVKDYPETLKLTGDVAGAVAGTKGIPTPFGKIPGFEAVQAKLASAASKPLTSTEEFHRIFSPSQTEGGNARQVDEAFKAAIPIIKEYSPDFVDTVPNKASVFENPMAALGRKLGLSGQASTHPSIPPVGPKMDPKTLRSGSVVEEFIDSSDRAQEDIFKVFESLVKPWEERGAVVDGNIMADAMRAARLGDSLIPQDVGARMLALENLYRGKQIPVRQAISELRDSNAGANGFFRKNIKSQNAAIATNAGDAAVETARGDAARQAIYGLLDSDNEGRAPAELMRLWGQINTVKHMGYKKLFPAYKGQDEGGVLSSLYNIGRSGVSAMQGNPAAAASAASQAANLRGGSIDDSLLKALTQYGSKVKTIEIPEPRVPAALLESGPIRQGPGPDTSGPTGQRPRYGSGMGTATGQRTLPAAESPIRYMDPVPPPPDPSGRTSGNVPRPGAGFSPSRADQRQLGPATENPDPRTRGAIATPPGPNSYPGQEPESGLYRTAPDKFTDPFGPLITGRDRSVALQQLKASGKASIIVNGQKRMWKLDDAGNIRRLR